MVHPRQAQRAVWQRPLTAAEHRQFNRDFGSQPSSVAERMADFFVDRQRDGFDDTTHTDLLIEGFTESEIISQYDAALALAAKQARDIDVDNDRASYDRAARVSLGALTIAGALDPKTVHTMLRQAGLATREIGMLFDDIVGEALKVMRETRAQTVEAH